MAITTGSEVKAAAQLTNEYTDEEILSEIDIVEAELYAKYTLPKRASFSVDSDYSDYFLNKDPIYEIVRLQGSVETTVDPSGYVTIDTGSYTHTAPNNYITLDADLITEYDAKTMRVRYIPKIFNLLATAITALNLVDPTTISDGENNVEAPLVARLNARVKRYKELLKPKTMFRSSAQVNFDENEYVSVQQSDLR